MHDLFLFFSISTGRKSKTHAVRFVSISAAEFHFDMPTTELIPLSASFVAERYKLEVKKEVGEEEASEETKQNSLLLIEWEQDFDSFLDSEERQPRSRRKKKRPGSGRRTTMFSRCGFL